MKPRKKKEKLGILGGIKAGLIKLVAIVKASLVSIYTGATARLSKEQIAILGLACFAVWPYLTPAFRRLIKRVFDWVIGLAMLALRCRCPARPSSRRCTALTLRDS